MGSSGTVKGLAIAGCVVDGLEVVYVRGMVCGGGNVADMRGWCCLRTMIPPPLVV